MAAKAVCVGINEFANLPMASWLAGCVNDANDIAAALRKHGFTARNVTVLTDEGATKAAVMAALTSMVEGAKAGDRLVFTFSSHGTQVTDVNGDEKVDGMDEAFACHDLKSGGTDWDPDTLILDDELKDLFGRVPSGVLLEVLMDTCHSGTGLRRITELQHDLLIGRRPRFIPPPSKRSLARSLEVEAERAAAPKRDPRGLAEARARRGPPSQPSRCCMPRANPSRPRRTRTSTTGPTGPSPTSSSRPSPRARAPAGLTC